MKFVNFFVKFVVVVGAINWGLWGFFQFDLVAFFIGSNATGLARFVYSIIGICGLLSLRCLCKCPCSCHKNNMNNNGQGGGCCK